MRHPIPLLGALAGVFVGCSSETVALPPPAPVNWQSLESHPAPDAGVDIVSAKERALAEAYASALTSPGLATLGVLLDDEAHFASPGMGDVHGRGPVVRAHDDLFGAFDDRHVTIRRVWRTPREQTVEWTMTGIQARDYMRVAATHKSVAFTGLTLLWTQDDGRITEVHVYVDVALVMGQLGVGAKPLLALPPPSASTAPAQAFEQSLPPSAAEQKNVALVRSWLDALENRHEAEFVDATDSDVEVSTLERPQAAHGADAIRTYYATMHRAVGQLDTTVSNAWGVENFAIVEYFIAGEQLGPIGWIAAQRDKVIRLELVDVIEMREGKIARVWRYDNPIQIVERASP